MIAGVDGCKNGRWIVLTLDRGSRQVEHHVVPTNGLAEPADQIEVMAIDIPIGLWDKPARRCDTEARRLLGPERGRSVFPAPCRAALVGHGYAEASGLNFMACGKKLTKQTFAILWRIREVDEWLRSRPDLPQRVLEVHPELCFYAWNGEAPMANRKKGAAGFQERHRLCEGWLPGAFDRVRDGCARSEVADDDILDAIAALWTAERLMTGQALRVPEEPDRDPCGLPMQMLA